MVVAPSSRTISHSLLHRDQRCIRRKRLRCSIAAKVALNTGSRIA
jgi:hypothetical protein